MKKRDALEAALHVWDEEVGEEPDKLRSCLGSWLREYRLETIEREIRLAAANDSLVDSDDVLYVIRKRLRRKREWTATLRGLGVK
jgi:hypothetical protein